MAEGSFEEIFDIKSREEFARNPVSLTGYLIDRKFPREDIAAYRAIARVCPTVVSKLLRGSISPEEAADLASRQAKVDLSTARSLFDRMCAKPVAGNETMSHRPEPAHSAAKPTAETKTEPPKTAPSPAPTSSVFKGTGETVVDGITYELSAREARLKRCDVGNPGATIPSKVDGLPVTTIGKGAYSGCESEFSLTVPSSVSKIEENAFSGCRKLRQVEIQGDVAEISPRTFSGCHMLESVRLPHALSKIGDHAFRGCRSLRMKIPEAVTAIGEGAFERCTSLESVEIPKSVTAIRC